MSRKFSFQLWERFLFFKMLETTSRNKTFCRSVSILLITCHIFEYCCWNKLFSYLDHQTLTLWLGSSIVTQSVYITAVDPIMMLHLITVYWYTVITCEFSTKISQAVYDVNKYVCFIIRSFSSCIKHVCVILKQRGEERGMAKKDLWEYETRTNQDRRWQIVKIMRL